MSEGHLASLLTPYALFSFGAVIGLTHLNANYSLCHMLLKGITFWMPPSDEEVEALPKATAENNETANNNLRQRKGKKQSQQNQQPKGQLPVQLARVGYPYLQHGYLYQSFNQLVYIAAISFSNLFFAEVWACGSGLPANDIAFLVSIVVCCYAW
jgi:hypothetical protein